MEDQQRFSRYGEVKTGTNNKFYQVEAQELEDGRATYEFRYGRIGTLGRVPKGGSATVSSFLYAKRICLEQWAKKSRGSGYREVTPLEALASAGEELTDRKRNGLSEVEIVIPCFHAGPSESRMVKFCGKYLTKLNVIRGSRWDMEQGPYRKQIEDMLKQYCSEYQRIKQSKGNGPNLDNSADTAARIFFGALKDDAGTSVYGNFKGVGVH